MTHPSFPEEPTWSRTRSSITESWVARARTATRGERLVWAVLALGCGALLLDFCVFRDLPMVDLPQHAAQVATWLNWDDPTYRPDDNIELNFRTPYLLAYGLARVLAPALGVVPALKLVVWLAVVGHVFAFSYMVRRLGHDPWLALLGLPTALGYCFYFGFFSFLVAVPLALLAPVLAQAHAARPNWETGLWLAGTLCLTLVAHGVAFAIAGAAVAALLLRGGGTLLARCAPLFAPAVLAAAWPSGSSMARMGGDTWEGGVARLFDLPAALVGMDSMDRASTIIGLAVLVSACALLGAPARRIERWLPLAIALLGFCLVPAQFRGYAFMSSRFAAFIVPGLLFAFAARSTRDKPGTAWLHVRRGLLVSVVASWMALFGVRLALFNREAAPLHALAARLPPALRIRSLIFDRDGKSFPGMPLFLHLSAYYYVEKGGTLSHSFVIYPNSVLRLKAGELPVSAPGSEWNPDAFDPITEVFGYDYFIVKSDKDRSRQLFLDSPVPILLDAHNGDWWGYRPAALARARQ